jgi:hypothetical protein
MLNQQLYPVHKELARSGVRSGNRAVEKANALGIARMLIERGLPLEVPQIVATAFHAFPASHGQAQAEVAHFLHERLVGENADADAFPYILDFTLKF